MTDKSTEFAFIQGLTAELSSRNLVFPTSLNATMKIRRALNNPDLPVDQVARIISAEPVLSAQVLRLANSATFNPAGSKIVELRTAVQMLGFGVVRNIAISVGMKQLKEHQSSGQTSERMEGLWTRSLRVAALSFVLAKNLTRLSPDKAMIAGMLHDVGKFYILNRARHYQQLFVSERVLWEIVDQWHADIGAAILENWEISDDIRAAVLNYRTLAAPAAKPTLTEVLAGADLLDAHIVANSLSMLDPDHLPVALLNLHLNLEQTELLMNESRDEIQSVLRLLS